MKRSSYHKGKSLLICCARLNPESSCTDSLKQIAVSIKDWHPVFDMAARHGLIGFLYLNLNKFCREILPPKVLATLKKMYLKNAARNLELCGKLIQIAGGLNKHHIPIVAFKGPAQSQLLYEDIFLRSFADLDILVRPKDALRAISGLKEMGLLTEVEIPASQMKVYMKNENFLGLKNRADTLHVDLHWEITGRYSINPVYFEDLETRFQQVEILNHKITTLSCEDSLIHLCVHGTSHCWEKLEFISAVAEIINRNRIKDWNFVLNNAKRQNCMRMVLLGLVLAEALLDAQLPMTVKEGIDTQPSVKKLANKIIENIMNGTSELKYISWRFSSVHFSARDSFIDRTRYAMRLIGRPTIREWDKFPLPDSFLFLYHFLRPYRLIKEGLKRI